MRLTTGQSHLSAIVQARRFSLFGHIARMPDETDVKKILTASPWRTRGDHQDDLVLYRWKLSNRTWNSIASLWVKQLTWLIIVHYGIRVSTTPGNPGNLLDLWPPGNFCV